MEIKNESLNSERLYRSLSTNYWNEAKRAVESGRPIAFCSIPAPIEILTAMDFFIFIPPNTSAAAGVKKVGTELIQVAEANNYPPDLCSYAKTDIGSVLSGEKTKSPFGELPKPDILLVASGQCHTIVKWFECLKRIYDVPLIRLDVPFIHDNTNAQEYSKAKSYVEKQLKEIIDFVEETTRRRFNYDRFEECTEFTGKACRLWKDILELRKNVPSPMTYFDLFTSMYPIIFYRGRPEGIQYYERLKVEMCDKVAQKIGAIPNEKYRLHWNGLPIWFRLKDLSTKIASLNACLLTGVYPLNLPFESLDSSRPLDSMADVFLQTYSGHGINYQIDALVRLVQEYSLDGLLMQMTRTCKAFTVGVQDIVREVKRRTGVPSLVFEGDTCDSRYISYTHIESRLDAFMELLVGRK